MSRKIIIRSNIKSADRIEYGCIIADSDTGLIDDVSFNALEFVSGDNIIFEYGEDFIIECGDFNAHSHPEQSIYTDLVDKQWDLATWCRNTIYKYSTRLTPEHIYYACCRAFSRMLGLGVTSVMVSFYCHNNRGNEFDIQVTKAAKATGIRLYFGRMNYDIITDNAYEEKKASQRCYFETPEEAKNNFLQLNSVINNPSVIAAPSIHSIHASTEAAIITAINLGNEYGRYIQFHLSEDKGDVDLALKWYGRRPVEYLVKLYEDGKINGLDNLMLSDCVWIDEREIELIKKHNMKIVLNPRMNDRIKTGEADLRRLLKAGIPIYIGTDGEASNDDLSITGEKEFLKDRFKDIAVEIIDNLGSIPFKFGSGYIGSMEKGSYCDLKVTKNSTVHDVFIGGKKIMKNGRLLNMDIEKDIERPLKLLLEKL